MSNIDTTITNRFAMSPGLLTNPSTFDTSFLTPDSLLLYCETRLRGLDTDIQKQFAEQRKNQATIKVLQDLMSKIKTAAGEVQDKDEFGFYAMAARMEQDSGFSPSNPQVWTEAINSVDDPQAKAAMKAAVTTWIAMNGKGGTIKFADLQHSILDPLDNARQGLSQGSELGMIQLQSMMSQRQTAVQLTTNLVQSLGEQMKQITGNIGK